MRESAPQVTNMAWVKPRFSRSQVDAAGAFLAPIYADGLDLADEAAMNRFSDALEKIDNWRSSHAYPLQVLKMALRGRAKRIDPHCVVAQRLKRFASIGLKLHLKEGMQLSRMHDIGGCRAVLRSITEVEKLVALYEKSRAKNPNDRPEFIKEYNYIAAPKADGYRGVHLVYKYRTGTSHRVYNGHRIEIQLRSRLQHMWATAVEVASTFTGQALKSNIGDDDWKRFFSLMGSVIAAREKRPLIPGTPEDPVELSKELAALSTKLRIHQSFEGWRDAVQNLVGQTKDAKLFLLKLDPTVFPPSIEITGYSRKQSKQANEEYVAAEKAAVATDQQVVLVSVDSVGSLRRAYPNYYLDTKDFLKELRRVCS